VHFRASHEPSATTMTERWMDQVRPAQIINDDESIPQAIFWRSVYYFSTNVIIGEDDLDEYEATAFTIGNRSSFDMRRYRSDPTNISSLYLSENIEEEVILETVDSIIKLFLLPDSAVGWKRGQEFEFGNVKRADHDQIREVEARILCLKIASQCEDQESSMSHIKREIRKYTAFSRRDLRPSSTSNDEPMWQKIIRNVVSHELTKSSIFHRGLARITRKGIKVTDEGMEYLKKIGFLSYQI
jgi:hypothetical protein